MCKEPTSEQTASAPPNIIVILADDAGYADFGFMGSADLETPNLDKLAGAGIVFTDAHTSATVCAPSRAGLLTGKYQQRFGFECNGTGGDLGIALDETTIADRLKAAGYATIAIGKWHVGHPDPYHPNERGFDEFYGFLGGSRSYFPRPEEDREGSLRAILHNRERVDFKGYLTDVFGDKSVEYVERYKDQPFFMYLSYNAVHTPMHAKEAHLEKYRDHPRRELAAMTWSLDENVGKLLDKLEAENLSDNTLIFFLSDNGGAHTNQSSCEPLKGWKGNKFEGGHRIPYTLTWPGKIQEGKGFDGLTSSLDIGATALAAAGLEAPEELDGVDLLPYVTGAEAGAPHQKLFWRKDKMAAMRDGGYKLIRLDGYGYRLYNLAEDLGETNGLRETEPQRFEQMKNDLEQWETQLMKPLWLEDEAWNQVTYEIHQALMENRPANYKSPGEMRRFLEQHSGGE